MRPNISALVVFGLACNPLVMKAADESSSTSDSSVESGTVSDSEPTTSETGEGFCAVAEGLSEEGFPERIADAICLRRKECNCNNEDTTQCVTDVANYFSEMKSYAKTHDMVFDGECLARRLQEFDAVDCKRSSYVDFLSRRSCGRCYLYHAPANTGDDCTAPTSYLEVVSPCASGGNICASYGASICSRPSGEGEECFFSGDCSSGLVCETGKDTCTASYPGEPCINPALFLDSSCSLGLWCDGETCQRLKPLGKSCNSNEECLTHHCNGNVCSDYVFACDLSGVDF